MALTTADCAVPGAAPAHGGCRQIRRELLWPLVFLVLVLLGTAPAQADNPLNLRIASYNVENYLAMDRMVEGRWRRDYPKPEAEKAALREIILEVSPDILALQEMGTDADLRELQSDLRKLGLDFPHRVLMEGPDEVRRTAVLSRIPFAGLSPHAEVDFAYFDGREKVKRGLLEVRFNTGGVDWSLFVVHLKSRWTERPDDPHGEIRRTREAQACRDLIRQRYPPESAPLYLIAGDLNDTRRSAPVRRFLQVSDTTLSRMVPCADSRGERWTHHWEREDVYSRIDYLLASPALLPFIAGRQGHIFDREPASSTASDHRMLYLDLAIEGLQCDKHLQTSTKAEHRVVP